MIWLCFVPFISHALFCTHNMVYVPLSYLHAHLYTPNDWRLWSKVPVRSLETRWMQNLPRLFCLLAMALFAGVTHLHDYIGTVLSSWGGRLVMTMTIVVANRCTTCRYGFNSVYDGYWFVRKIWKASHSTLSTINWRCTVYISSDDISHQLKYFVIIFYKMKCRLLWALISLVRLMTKLLL